MSYATQHNQRNKMLDAAVKARGLRSDELIQWLYPKIEGITVAATDRMRIAGSVLDIALDHHRAIVLLIGAEIPSTAFALMRLLLDAYCRGVWLHQRATEEQIQQYKADKLDLNFTALVDSIETLEAFSAGLLSDIRKRSWKAMCSYAHAGFYQVARRNTPESIEPAFETAELLEVLDAADALAIMAAIDIATMGNDEGFVRELGERMSSLNLEPRNPESPE